MHNKHWEELIPFYVAGSLTRAEALAFEQHAAACPDCTQAIHEWRQIASAVHADAASHFRELPPLAPQIQAMIAADPRADSGRQTTALMPARRQTVTPRSASSLSLAAAVVTVLVFGGLIAYLTLRSAPQPDSETAAPVIVAAATATHTPFVTLTPYIGAPFVIVTDIPSRTPMPFATHTPSAAPELPLSMVTLPPLLDTPIPTETPTDSDPTALVSSQIAVPVAIVNSESINLRAGPGTDYATIRAAYQGDRLHIIARAGSGSSLWYLVEDGLGRRSWLFAGIVTVEPIDAIIELASTIPAPPPTETPLPTETATPGATASPTQSVIIQSGAWTNSATVVEHQCGGQLGVTSLTTLALQPVVDQSALTITLDADGTVFTLYRTGEASYSGTYASLDTATNSTVTVTVQITFETLASYTGQQTVIYTDGCLVRSLWTGRADS